ncbi:MAG: hypothetical protein Q9M20_04915, partial [Mariprofundaceae bacterium]|nr:hypothetical protein [Mariprofundaceae bacterium]
MSTTVSGSAGDGPVKNGKVSVLDANGSNVITTPANPSTGLNAQFNFTVPSGTALPLTITVTGGVDMVTNALQDFPLRTAVTTLPASGTVTGNANPLSTLAVASAEAQPGGLSAANLTTATNNVLGAMGFGLAAGINPLSTTVNNSNAASIVRASEAAAELIRRTSNASGGTLSNTILSIAQDLTDGAVDGNAAAGAAATQVSNTSASQILNQQAQVSAETLANNLTVTTPAGTPIPSASGVNFATTLNTSITTTGHTGNVSKQAPTQAFLDQTRAAIHIANTLAGGTDPALISLSGSINTLTAGTAPSTVQQNNPAELTNNAVASFTTATTAAADPVAATTALATVAADTTKPVITLNGVTPVTVEAGAAYIDAYTTVRDNVDAT